MNEVSTHGQKKLTRIVRILKTLGIIVGIMTPGVSAMWFIMSQFYIHRDIVDKDWIQRSKYEDLRFENELTVRELENTRSKLIAQKEQAIAAEDDNKTKVTLNVLIEKREELANTIKSVQSEYVAVSESVAATEAERQRNGNIQKRFVVVTKELIEKSKRAEGNILYRGKDDLGNVAVESNLLFSIIRDQNMQAGDKIELPGYDPNVGAAALMGRRDALYNVLKDLREQVKALNEQITALASSKAR